MKFSKKLIVMIYRLFKILMNKVRRGLFSSNEENNNGGDDDATKEKDDEVEAVFREDNTSSSLTSKICIKR